MERSHSLSAVAVILGAAALWLSFTGSAPAQTNTTGQQALPDRHAGYYYPEPGSQEVYKARAQTMPQASRSLRLGFVTGFTNKQFEAPYPPTFTMFAKGAEAQKLIVVALEDSRVNSIYRARAFFAMMTAFSRSLPIFRDNGVEDRFTFFDLAKLLGFQQITITDGNDFAHQVIIE